MNIQTSPLIDVEKKTIQFFILHDHIAHVSVDGASQVSLSGSFNHWAKDIYLLQPDKEGSWKIEIPMLPKGEYYYKFLVDDNMWMEDVDNPNRIPDGLAGFYSVLNIESECLV